MSSRVDRSTHHQLVFELAGLAALVLATREVALVVVPGAIVLPATRQAWWCALRQLWRNAIGVR